MVSSFFKTYPELAKYENEVKIIYRGYKFHHIWYDENGVLEFANSLYSKVKWIATEGVYSTFPTPKKLKLFLKMIMKFRFLKLKQKL